MNVRPANLVQSDAQGVFNISAGVPIPDALRGAVEDTPAQRTGLIPMLALGIAILATVVWNGFLLWEVASFILDWLGF